MLCYKLLPPKHIIALCWSESIESISHMQKKKLFFTYVKCRDKNYCSFVILPRSILFLLVAYNVYNALLQIFFNVTRESFHAKKRKNFVVKKYSISEGRRKLIE